MTGLHSDTASDANRQDASQRDLDQRAFHREQLSAMMDCMLSTDESRFLLRRMQHDAELAGSWERWQLYGDAMRGQAGRALPADFNRRVARAIAAQIAEDTATDARARQQAGSLAMPHPVSGRPLLRWGGGAALAASVAIAALIGTRNFTDNDPQVMPAQVATAASPAAAPIASDPIVVARSAPSGSSLPQAPATTSAAATTEPRPALLAAADTRQLRSRADASRSRNRAQSAADAAWIRSDDRPGAPTAIQSTASVAENTPAPVADSATQPARSFGPNVDLAAKPWPRSLLPDAAVGGMTVDYGAGGGSALFHPFQPRVERAPAASQPQNEDASIPQP